MSDPTDDNCPPRNNLLSPPATSPDDCKASFVLKTQVKYGDPSKYEDSGLEVCKVTVGPMTLEQIKHSCEFSGHEETLRELEKKHHKEIFRDFVHQLGKLNSFGRIDSNGTYEADVVLEIDIVPELLLSQQCERCAICLESVADDEGYFLPCSHMYHINCIRQWLRRKPECPLCRFLLSEPQYSS